MSHTYTTTYTTLEVAQSSFDDIKQRLDKAGVLRDYLTTDRKCNDMILFGSVGLVVETPTLRQSVAQCNALFVCNFHDTGGPQSRPCSILTYRRGLDTTRGD